MDEKLKYYVSSDLYTPIMNILLNKNINAYSDIGKYLIEKGYVPVTYGDKFENIYNIYKNGNSVQKIFNKKDINIFLRMSAIMFLTSDLNEKVLKSLFNQSVKHSEFGEGFDKKRKYSYISYFTEMNGYKFHFGIDHRGTNIEVDKYISYDNEHFNKELNTNLNKLYGQYDTFKYLGWSGFKDIESIYNYFYENSSYYLVRKKLIFDEVYNICLSKKRYRKK